MALLVQSWVILTVVLIALLSLVIAAQGLAAFVRRAAKPAAEPAAAAAPIVASVHVPAPRMSRTAELATSR